MLEDASPSVITGNVIEECEGQTVALSKESRRSSITGNVFADNGAGITLNQSVDVVVSGNTFAGITAPAVKSSGQCKRVVVDVNAISE